MVWTSQSIYITIYGIQGIGVLDTEVHLYLSFSERELNVLQLIVYQLS